jgi:hypothetical protein
MENKKIACESKMQEKFPVRIRLIKAPLVNTEELRRVLFDRARALVL